MKATVFTVTDETGHKFKWSFVYVSHTWSTLGRYMNGWLLTTHDGCERFNEGNWIDFVPFVRLVASNYGVETRIS